jgi:oxygen-independent coproporphyrinogen-3 oxidase
VPWLKPFQKKINEQELPDPDTKFSTFLMARERFIESGYEPIGMDHFAVPSDELALARRQLKLRRNFQGYTVKPETHVYALGISAISDFGDLYVQNLKKFNTYYDRIDAGKFAAQRGYWLDANDQLRRQIITRLLCNFELDVSNIEKEFQINFADYFSTELLELKTFVDEGLLQITSSQSQKSPRLIVTSLGQLFIRNICMIFDDHLRRRQGESRQMFSKTV